MRISIDYPVEAIVEAATPEHGIVDKSTALGLVSQTVSGAKETDPKLRPFSARTAPHVELEGMWESVIGYETLKRDLLREVATIYRNLQSLGPLQQSLSLNGRYLFEGPPGTAKTTLASGLSHALSKELGGKVGVLSLNTTALLSKFVGESTKNVTAVFEEIKVEAEALPLSILVMDEFDAIAADRDNDQDHAEARRAVNALLMALDRLSLTEHRVVLVAITNLAHILDRAALRRFDRVFTFALPDERMRLQIVEAKLRSAAEHLQIKRAWRSSDLLRVSSRTTGYSGADLSRLVREASLLALMDGHRIDGKVLESALARTPAASAWRKTSP